MSLLENSQNNQIDCIEIVEGQSFVADFNSEKTIVTEDVWFAEAAPVKATLVGEQHLNEGDSGTYKVQLSEALDVDTYYDIQINDGTAKWAGNEPGIDHQDIMWGGFYSVGYSSSQILYYVFNRVPNGTYLSDGDRPQIGPDDATWDFSLIQDGVISDGNTIRVKVAAGQTMSETFDIKAWEEKITIDRFIHSSNAGQEGTETFSISLAGSSDEHIILGSDLNVGIKDTTHVVAVSPIAFDLNGDGKIGVTGETTSQDKSGISYVGDTVKFDIDADGDLDKIEWLAGDGDAFLVDNRDGNAANDMDGARLFGDQGGKYTDGYEKLAKLDVNNDGTLVGEELEGLELWMDDGDAVVEEGELVSLAEKGILQISVERENVTNERGENLIRSVAYADAEKWNDVSYSLEGEDADLFSIDTETGKVNFKQSPDFENPLDADGDNIYDITVVRTFDDGSVVRRDSQVKVKDNITDNNLDPNAIDDHTSVFAGEKVGIRVLDNDSDPNGDMIFLESFSQAVNGKVVRNRNGTPDDLSDDRLVYTPNEDFTGTDSFTYTISDGNGGTDTATVTVDVQEILVNTAPVAVDDDAMTTAGTKVGVRVLNNDSDPDGDTVFLQSFGQASNGTVVRNNNGTIGDRSDDKLVYTPNEDFTGTDIFTYTINDGNGGTDTATVTITIQKDSVNAAPIAIDDHATTIKERQVGIRVLNNDSDPDGDSLRIESFTQGNFGQVVRNNNGTIDDLTDDRLVYKPAVDFVGIDSFSYTITDDNGGTDTATVTVTVKDGVVNPPGNFNLIVGTPEVDELEGTDRADFIKGLGSGDTLRGGAGNDKLVGATGDDKLFGNAGNDTLNGTNAAAAGENELDILEGGEGADVFVLGNQHSAYYSTNGNNDFALIQDFEIGVDKLRISGSVSEYSFGNNDLWYKGDLIASFRGIDATEINDEDIIEIS